MDTPGESHQIDDVSKLPAADLFVVRARDCVISACQSPSSAQVHMCETADAVRRAAALTLTEFALLSARGSTLSPLPSQKLLNKWLGPFAAIECVGKVAHELMLPASMTCIRPVSHVMLLRLYKDGECQASPPAAVLPDDTHQMLAHTER